jgi:CheY-like chemotaxis protein
MKRIKTVLLVDDDEPTNFINKKIIQASDLVDAIHISQSGQEALDFLGHESDQADPFPVPELIFLDINMPAMDGWEFLAHYKKLKNEQKSKVIIVMLTTSLNPDDEVKAKDMKEVCAFRNKPLTKQLLEEIAAKYF